jgi:hypothetical protein
LEHKGDINSKIQSTPEDLNSGFNLLMKAAFKKDLKMMVILFFLFFIFFLFLFFFKTEFFDIEWC